MKAFRTLTITSLAAPLLAGCAHTVPGLNMRETESYETKATVSTILNHIACEIAQADASALGADGAGKKLTEGDYIATVNLVLQVQDTAGITPTLAYTEGLKPPATSLVTNLGLDFNGQRRRNFSSNTIVEVAKLPSCADTAQQLRYNLQGDLHIVEIVQNGLAARDSSAALQTNKSPPTFGGVVEFIVTRSVTAFGPTWTLRYWKGPSGSNGLINGKAVYTNTATLTFAPRYKEPQVDTLAEVKTRLASIQAQLAKLIEQQGRTTETLNEKGFLKGRGDQAALLDLRTRSALLEVQIGQAQGEINRLNQSLGQAQIEAQRTADSRATDAAIAASRDLQTNLLLQNLTVPR